MITAAIVHADCLVALRQLDDASIDAVVTDPPAGIGFMGKAWDRMKTEGLTELQAFQEFIREVFTEVYRVLKPGGHAVVWALPRTSHHTAMGLERAGFDIRDNGTYLFHVFGSGFPKSHNVAHAVDALLMTGGSAPHNLRKRAMGDDYEAHRLAGADGFGDGRGGGFGADEDRDRSKDKALVTEAAKAWEGWGTALKPAVEFWIVARKPLDGTVAENVLAHGTGALNIDGCRIATDDNLNGGAYSGGKRNPVSGDTRDAKAAGMYGEDGRLSPDSFKQPEGRWPAHLVLDEGAAALLDEQSGISKSNVRPPTGKDDRGVPGFVMRRKDDQERGHADVGGASRFFYVPKANKRDKDEGLDDLPERTAGEKTEREEGTVGISPYAGSRGPSKNSHPTVKSTALMAWLVRLVTPPAGIVLDPFMGSGSTGKAALLEGFSFVGIEREAEYVEIARRRLEHAAGAPVEVVCLENP